MKREPRLKFTQEEMNTPELEKPIQKVKKAATKADKAQAKIPKKSVKQRSVDPATGKVTTKLSFEDKKPPSKPSHAAKAAPVSTASIAAHREIRQYEDDNVGLEAAHFVEGNAESGGRLTTSAVRSQRLRPYRKAAAAGNQKTVCRCQSRTLRGNHEAGGGGHRQGSGSGQGDSEKGRRFCPAAQEGLSDRRCCWSGSGLYAERLFLLHRDAGGRGIGHRRQYLSLRGFGYAVSGDGVLRSGK